MHDIDNINTFQAQSPTAVICDNAALYGATPERGEFDPREIWNRDEAVTAVSEAFRILTADAAPDGFQLADEREHLLWGLVNAFPGNGITGNLFDKAKSMGIPVMAVRAA